MLQINNIDVYHGTCQTLWDVSMEVRQGEILALIGSNAAGKSTLINTISGILRPAKGSIVFEGRDVTRLDPSEIVALGISQVSEERNVFPDMSVLDNLILGSYSARARAERAKNLKEVYRHFPILEKRKKQMARTLSGGEKQMLAIGRGLMANPKLLILDEISLGLAPIVTGELYKVLRDIRDRGITVVIVEQNVRRSLKEADRVYIIKSGRIVLCRNANELQEDEIMKAYFGV
ncbi:MAG: ABC transporter ATP-binding protein [Peptococcaceae bacterium]|nr:ABC transporter ATP-binding protein [Peptococcaceae bacterium]